MAETFESFMRQYGPADGRYPVIDVGEDIAQWPTVVVTFGDKTAVLHLCGVGADGDQPHLCIDIHAFVGDRLPCSAWRTASGTRRSTTPRRARRTAGRRFRASAS